MYVCLLALPWDPPTSEPCVRSRETIRRAWTLLSEATRCKALRPCLSLAVTSLWKQQWVQQGWWYISTCALAVSVSTYACFSSNSFMASTGLYSLCMVLWTAWMGGLHRNVECVCVCVCVVPFSNKLMSLVTSSNGVIPPWLVQLTSMYWSPFWFTQK